MRRSSVMASAAEQEFEVRVNVASQRHGFARPVKVSAPSFEEITILQVKQACGFGPENLTLTGEQTRGAADEATFGALGLTQDSIEPLVFILSKDYRGFSPSGAGPSLH